jgi:hypothetical protein
VSTGVTSKTAPDDLPLHFNQLVKERVRMSLLLMVRALRRMGAFT